MSSATLPAIQTALDAKGARMRAVVGAHYDALWRFLRRMGVPESQVEDAAQQVLLVFARRSGDVEEDAERPFLFGTALRVASDIRRKIQQGRELIDAEALLHHADPRPDAEHRLGHEQLRRHLDKLLDELLPEHRSVFVLAELEELTMAEIARLLSIPPGTVASRLRRAREVVEARAIDLRAELEREGLP